MTTSIVGYIDIDTVETKEAPLCYGGKIPSSRMIKWEGKWRRVYVACYGNDETAYITKGKDWLVIR